MSDLPAPVQPEAPTIPVDVPLPLRYDDPVSLALIIKALLVTALLLAAVYIALRWYARRGTIGIGTQVERASLQCTAALRLSARTKVYHLKTSTAELLVTETPAGTTVTLLPPNADASG